MVFFKAMARSKIHTLLEKRKITFLPIFITFAADFPPDVHKFNQRTFRVRLLNLCTSDKKSSHKIRHKEIPRAHIEEWEANHG